MWDAPRALQAACGFGTSAVSEAALQSVAAWDPATCSLQPMDIWRWDRSASNPVHPYDLQLIFSSI